jgi:GNAT superfamily N-acetyltransferase
MNETSIRIVTAGEDRDAYLPLFFLADDSVTQVQDYYQLGDLYALDLDTGKPMAIVLAIPVSDCSIELKAVAVDAKLHGQGIGKRILGAVLESLRSRRLRQVIVGTGNSSIGQLAFYQKAGFRLWTIERDFFSPKRGYREGIQENGIPLRDMVWMDLEL